MTPEERKLWHLFLKSHPTRFRRQAAIGNFIVDFYCPKAKLVVEIDGTQHLEDKGQQKDEMRTKQLEDLGLRVIRISNRQINHEFESVCHYINEQIKQI